MDSACPDLAGGHQLRRVLLQGFRGVEGGAVWRKAVPLPIKGRGKVPPPQISDPSRKASRNSSTLQLFRSAMK